MGRQMEFGDAKAPHSYSLAPMKVLFRKLTDATVGYDDLFVSINEADERVYIENLGNATPVSHQRFDINDVRKNGGVDKLVEKVLGTKWVQTIMGE